MIMKNSLRDSLNLGKSTIGTHFAFCDPDIAELIGSYCQIWCLRVVGHAAIWLGFVVSIPSLNVTPVMTLAR